MLSANQIAGFLNFNITKTIGGIKLILYMILGGCGQACTGMYKEAIKT